ncbi:hypothetical protein NBRC10513_000767 [Rhodotorula toruloides]
MHPNSPAALFGSFSLPSPIPDDFATRADIEDFREPSGSTWKQRLRAKDSPDCAVFDPDLLPAFFSSFRAFLDSRTDAAFTRAEAEGRARLRLEIGNEDYSQRFSQLHRRVLGAKAGPLGRLVEAFTELLDRHLPESVRAGPVSYGRSDRYRGDLDRNGDVINLTPNRLSSSGATTCHAELKKRDSHLYSLLLRIVVSCRSRSCNTFVLFDYLHYLIGFLVPLDPSSPASKFRLVFSALARCDSRETPLVQVATALLYADRFFGDELRRRTDSIVNATGSPAPASERANEQEKRDGKAGDGGPATRTRQKLAATRTLAPLEKIQRFRLAYPDGTPAEFTPFDRFNPLDDAVSPVASQAIDEAVTTLEMDDYLGHGATSDVFRAYLPSSSSSADPRISFIVKLPRNPSDAEKSAELLHEAKVLASPSMTEFEFVPKLHGAFKACLEGKEGKEVIALLEEDCGEPILRWADLTDEEIDQFTKDLATLHTDHHICHEDLTTEYSDPHNILVSPASPSSSSAARRVRVIDFAWAQDDHECEGEDECGELRMVRETVGWSRDGKP